MTERQLAYAKFHRPVIRALTAVPVDEIGHALASQQLRRSGDFEMQMRLAGIAGSTDARHDLATPHAVPRLDAQASRVQMHVISELTATHVERDCVSPKCVERHPHSRTERFVE